MTTLTESAIEQVALSADGFGNAVSHVPSEEVRRFYVVLQLTSAHALGYRNKGTEWANDYRHYLALRSSAK